MALATITDTKPRLRGWLHLGAFPAALIAGLILIGTAPTAPGRLSTAIYIATSVTLFGVSALYHRTNLTPRATTWLKRLDHANIYLIIAGTYTPIAVLALDGTARTALLTVVWTGAAAGVAFRTLWVGAPRWLYTPLYIILGWAAIFAVPELIAGAGVAATVLIFTGGVLYTVGGVIYALKRPNPSVHWFGFHELFHAFTVAAYAAQFAAVAMVVAAAA
ncbi:hemolysin III family protein [Glycomyces sp. TRM65418]|uniref:PAQR family membrane homeostasis protein TrhA n=1 Tax=Glycomyces sp. TRM65418 TaxID=2867006 RepID=UPI001CE6872C|nr:hemolysin III family protein [Glycomyces sp. TRM65418]MCC3763251.1 hemolysin III family protein [Glycomyces sp. TRM65418]QZD57252.1 hemolysin III family protein [Glycomyces sp. TRM65418]